MTWLEIFKFLTIKNVKKYFWITYYRMEIISNLYQQRLITKINLNPQNKALNADVNKI